MLARSGLPYRRLNHHPELAVEQALGPSRQPATGCPHKIQIPALEGSLPQGHPRPRVRHCLRCLGLGPSLQPILERLLVRSLDPRAQVRGMDSEI
jgi:hypothetical protein